ncbi:MAG: hypothetical protein V4671_16805 [Armatimonadota bacterium]
MYEVFAIAGTHQTAKVIVHNHAAAERARVRVARTLTRRLQATDPDAAREVLVSVTHTGRVSIDTAPRRRKVKADPLDPFA